MRVSCIGNQWELSVTDGIRTARPCQGVWSALGCRPDMIRPAAGWKSILLYALSEERRSSSVAQTGDNLAEVILGTASAESVAIRPPHCRGGHKKNLAALAR